MPSEISNPVNHVGPGLGRCLSHQGEVVDAFQNAPEIVAWSDAHGSISVQKGQPTTSAFLASLLLD